MSNRSVFNIQRVYVIKHQWNIFHLTESQPRNHLNINTSESPIMNTLFSIKLLIGWPSRISCLKEQIRETVTEENASISLLNYSSFPCVFRTLGWKRLCVCVCFVKQWLMLTTRGKNNEARLAGNTVREKQIWGGQLGILCTLVCVCARMCACVLLLAFAQTQLYFPWHDRAVVFILYRSAIFSSSCSCYSETDSHMNTLLNIYIH